MTAITGIKRRGFSHEIHPACRQYLSSLRLSGTAEKLSEPGIVPRGCMHDAAADQRAACVEFGREAGHPQRLNETAANELHHCVTADLRVLTGGRSEEHTSELQSLMRISYAVFCLKNKNNT